MLKRTLLFAAAILSGVALFSQPLDSLFVSGIVDNANEQEIEVDIGIVGENPEIITTTTNFDGYFSHVFATNNGSVDWVYATLTNCNDELLVDTVFVNSDSLANQQISFYFNYCNEIQGCTDPAAVNYNPDATIDDGSCVYNDSCETNFVNVQINAAQWGSEISWNIVQDGVEIAGGSGYDSNTTNDEWVCLEDGCYTFEMYDSFGDGWNGGTFSVSLDNQVLTAGTLNEGEFGMMPFGVNAEGCDSLNIQGCTDPEALNYNPNATVDDGSCIYASAENDFCQDATSITPGTYNVDNTEANQNEGYYGECWNFGSGEGEQSSVWYSFTTPAEPASITLEAISDGTNTLTDTQFGLFTDCGGDMIYCDGNSGEGLLSKFEFDCGELDTNTTYILMIDGWNGDAGTCQLDYSVDTLCNEVFGCTDPEALNYDPNATVNDGSCVYDSCATNLVHVNIVTSNWGHEISWNITQDGEEVAGGGDYQDDFQYTDWLCLDDGCYTFEMFDSFGDGWNGGEFSVWLGSQMLASGTLNSGSYGAVQFGVNSDECDSTQVVYGCTDPEAINYNPEATVDDGSCEYESDCELNSITVDLGLVNQPIIEWDLVQGDSLIEDGGFNPSNESFDFCLDEGCYAFVIEDFSNVDWGGGISISVNGVTVLADSVTSSGDLSFEFGVNTTGCDEDIEGCTDPNALNYDPDATVNDGSCIYPDSCEANLIQLDVNTEAWAGEISWNLVQDGQEIAGGSGYQSYSENTDWLCLEDGCYTFEMFDSFGDGWNGAEFVISQGDNVLADGTLLEGEYGQITFGINTSGCDSTVVIEGCTDPAALNYNPEATVDDGSCVYDSTFCSIDFSVIPDSSGQNVIWVVPSENLASATELEWSFGDGTTSTDIYPSHQYDGEGPYTICLSGYMEAEGVSCSFEYCEEISADLIGGRELGFWVNVIENAETVGIENAAQPEPLTLMPNPTTDIVNLKFSVESTSEVDIAIYTTAGKLILKQRRAVNSGENYLQLDMQGLSDGLYMIEMSTDKGKRFGKVIKR